MAGESKHTPVPWCIERESDSGGGDRWGVFAVDRHRVAVLSRNADALANAKLIVRAVNAHEALVEALKKVTDLLDSIVPAGDELDEPINKAVAEARAALKLAEGSNG